MLQELTTWTAALATLAILTFLFAGDNKIFRFAQNVFVGVAAGYGLALAYSAAVRVGWTPLVSKGQWGYLVPMVLGLMLYTRFVRGVSYLSRTPMAFLVGLGASLSMKGIATDFAAQIRATLLPLNTVNNLILVLGTASVLVYFLFTVKRHPVVNGVSTFGKWVLMAAFGAAFGNAVQGRISLFVGTLQFLLRDWLHLIS
ncbi:MAG: hypothetical protein QME87_08690 [Bacillota bacterium]|nr:hypothetical protein [Bacillota bacterium]